MRPEARAFDAVVFDLDGTLIDSAPAIRAIAGRFLAEQGAAPLTLDETRAFIGHGAAHFLRRALAARDLPADDAAVATHYPRFIAIYGAAPPGDNVPFGGIVETLGELERAGVAVGLCTNKPDEPTRRVLDAFGLAFAVVVTGDTLPQKKPSPKPLEAVVAGLSVTVARTLFVGDSEIDALTARAAGCPFALHTAGYHFEFSEAAQPDYFVADIPSVLDIVINRGPIATI